MTQLHTKPTIKSVSLYLTYVTFFLHVISITNLMTLPIVLFGEGHFSAVFLPTLTQDKGFVYKVTLLAAYCHKAFQSLIVYGISCNHIIFVAHDVYVILCYKYFCYCIELVRVARL